MILNKQELLNVNGGAVNVTGSLVNAIVDIINIIVDLGRSIGSSVGQMIKKSSCSV